jgi:hypothetical protein
MNEIGGGTFYKVAYSVSDTADLITRVLKSIKSLERFVPKENVIVFYTSPRSVDNYRRLSEIANVKMVDNITIPFDAQFDRAEYSLKGARRYGEKVHLCEVDCPNVIFLDADTTIKKDITQLLEGDFDFFARASPYNFTISGKLMQNNKINQEVWKGMFEAIGKQPIAMFNCGFLIFKNYYHQKVRDRWLRCINDDSFPNPSPPSFLKEQWALSVALASVDARIKYMTFEHHAYFTQREYHLDTYVLHARIPPLYKRFRNFVGKYRRRIQQLILKNVKL